MQKRCQCCGKSHTKLERCKFCGEFFCEEHLPAKMCLTRRLLEDKSMPIDIKTELEKEWNRNDGHVDAEYTSERWKQFEKKKKEYYDSISKFLDASKSQKSFHAAENPVENALNPKEKPNEKSYKTSDEIWNEVKGKHKHDRHHDRNTEKNRFKFPSIKLVAFLVIIASIAVLYSFAPTETKDNISQSLEKITSSISSAKDNISQSISTNIVSLNQETSIADINKNMTKYMDARLQHEVRADVVVRFSGV